MKKKKVFVTLGAIVLMLGLVMNVQYALADYGIETNSLPIMVLAQSGGGGSSSSSDYGHQHKEGIKCSIETVYGSTTTIKTTTGEYYWCDGSNLVERCVNYNPCDGFY